MKKAMLLALGLLILAGAAFAQQPDSNPPAKDEAAQSPPAQPPAAGQASPGSDALAHLRVYRARRYMGSALAPSIYVDDKQIVRIGNGRRASIKLTPGTHTIRSDDKSSAVSVEAKAGQDYFVRVDEETGFWKGHGKLTMLLPEQGRAEFQLQKPVEDERKVVKDMIEEDTEAKK
jgi:Protein of unknown function (DUF2846)